LAPEEAKDTQVQLGKFLAEIETGLSFHLVLFEKVSEVVCRQKNLDACPILLNSGQLTKFIFHLFNRDDFGPSGLCFPNFGWLNVVELILKGSNIHSIKWKHELKPLPFVSNSELCWHN
jgi:hypothetical protein